ncbi:MAG: metallophosphoesterase family protein [Cyclonatronaceae bacterium]
MKKIGLISDTHGYLDFRVKKYFEDCDEIWHAGDFGNYKIAEQLQKITHLRGVYGNIDGADIRSTFPQSLRFELEGVDFFITHIGGNPGRYALPCKKEIEENPPNVMICGHTHMLKVARDKKNNNLLYINPGAAGKQGFHIIRTIVRFDLDQGRLSNLEVINLGGRTKNETITRKNV